LVGDRLLPDQFGLAQNYPNPFNPTTSISFSVPTATNVTLEIFNILGEKVATPFNGMASSGINEVNRVKRLPPGFTSTG